MAEPSLTETGANPKNPAEPTVGEYPGMRPPAKLLDPVQPPTPIAGQPLTHWHIIAWLGRLQRGRALWAWVVSVLVQVALLLSPWLISKIIDDGIRAQNSTALVHWGVALLGATLVTPVLAMLRHRIMTVYRTVLRAISVRAVSRQIAHVGAPFSNRMAGGEMTTASSTDLDRLGMLYTSLIPGSAALLGIIGGIVVLSVISPWVAAASFAGIVVMWTVAKPIAQWFYRADVAYREQQGTFNNYTHDTITGLRILTGIGGKERYASILARESAALQDAGMHLAGRLAAMIAAVYLMPSVTFVLVVWVAAAVAMSGQISVGQLLQAVTTAGAMMGPMMMVNGMFRDIPAGITAAKRATEIFNLTPETLDTGTQPAPTKAAQLHDHHSGLTITPGVALGIAAQSLTDAEMLLERLARFAPENQTEPAPTVRWGAHPHREYPLADVRQRILLAESQAYFMAGTLRESLNFGQEYADEDIHTALTVAHANDIVAAFPNGLGEFLPAGASTVSGGQRQRLRLARAILADPEVLLLCEPTSALDATTEAVVAEKIVRHRHGKTTVLVSTSPLVLAHCDQVAYLPGGGQAANLDPAGHDHLAATNADYRALVLREHATSAVATPEG